MSDVFEHLIPAQICVVAFASGGGEFSKDVPHFEFGNSLKAYGVAYVLLRDSTDFSCQYGIKGIGDRNTVATYILQLSGRYDRVILIGLSVGAMTAILYSELVGEMVEVLALSPYTSLGSNPDAVFGPGWRDRVPNWVNYPILTDLVNLIEPSKGPRAKVTAFYSDGADTAADKWHADRIGIRKIVFVPGASHAGLGKLMRDNGMLKQLIAG